MNDLIELCRHESRTQWAIVENSNFSSEFGEGIAAKLMVNSTNEYAEYKNCGVIYRVIRKKDLPKYV